MHTQNLKDSTYFQVRNMKATASHMALEKLINITTEIELRASKRIYKAYENRSLHTQTSVNTSNASGEQSWRSGMVS